MVNDELPSPFSQISGSCAISLLEVVDKCIHCSSEIEYKIIFKLLNNLISFDNATSGLAELDKNNNVRSYELINISYPESWLKLYNQKQFNKIDVIVHKNFTQFIPQYWDYTYKENPPSKKFILLASDFNIRHGYTFGARPFGGCNKASLYSFSGNLKKYSPRIVSILRIAVPHLHLASARILADRKRQQNRKLLSDREIEVLNWLKKGKSSWDISAIMNISTSTVNFHIYNIMKKLDVVNRTQAVAAATHLGILEID